MSHTIAKPTENRQMPSRQVDPHRLVWGVLLLSFAIFCVICVVVVIGAEYFLFQSSVSMHSTLNVGRGTIAVTDLANPADTRVGFNGQALTRGAVISTDPQSQGTVEFYDERASTIVAMITLHRSSSITLLDAARPRFEWSRIEHEIVLNNVIGELNIDTTGLGDQSIRIRASTPAGAIVNFDSAGRYDIEAASEQLRIFNRSGKVTIISPNRLGRDVPVGGVGVVNYEDDSIELRNGYVNFIKDAGFEILATGATEVGNSAWGCGNDPGDDPPGNYELIKNGGLQVLRFYRGDNAESHGRSFCVQSFGQNGIGVDPEMYESLAFRASFNIEDHSLGTCGTKGSECPLTLRMDYIDADGVARKWYHGFYANESPGSPLRCDSETCREDHDRVHRQAWYTYESPNLLTFFQPPAPEDAIRDDLPDMSPRRILSVWLYASGHEYDVRVHEVSLIALPSRGAEE